MNHRSTLLAALAATTAIGALAWQSQAPSVATLPTASTPASTPTSRPTGTPPIDQARAARTPGPKGGARGEEDSSIAKLDPALRNALDRATRDAHAVGVEIQITSGWRSPAHQARLLEQAIVEHGSRAEAARWVATPQTSPHVSGDAVDIGGQDAMTWLSRHGSDYGLCQIYRNEAWHFELRAGAADRGCPAMYADPTHDPRMQR